MPFRIRHFSDADISALVRLLNEALGKSYEFTPYTDERLRSWIQEGRLKIFIAEENDQIIGSAAYNDGHWGEEVEWLVVPESPNRRIVEKSLVEEVEKCVKRGAVFTSVDAESPTINDWIKRDYRAEGGLYHMVVRLDGLKPLPKVPEDIILRNLNPNEEKELVEAVNAGFGWERLKMGIVQTWKTENPPFSEEWVHVADSNNKIVSVVASRPDTRHNESFDGKRGYLGPATTLVEFRGKNLASALTVQAMNLLFEKGMDSVALYTAEQNVPSVILLRKLSFEIEHHWKFMRKNLQPKNQ
jgi:ribosomal protein S18 acetylase RimI-like enzyme